MADGLDFNTILNMVLILSFYVIALGLLRLWSFCAETRDDCLFCMKDHINAYIKLAGVVFISVLPALILLSDQLYDYAVDPETKEKFKRWMKTLEKEIQETELLERPKLWKKTLERGIQEMKLLERPKVWKQTLEMKFQAMQSKIQLLLQSSFFDDPIKYVILQQLDKRSLAIVKKQQRKKWVEQSRNCKKLEEEKDQLLRDLQEHRARSHQVHESRLLVLEEQCEMLRNEKEDQVNELVKERALRKKQEKKCKKLKEEKGQLKTNLKDNLEVADRINEKLEHLKSLLKSLRNMRIELGNSVETEKSLANLYESKWKEESEKCKNLKEDIEQLMMIGQEKDRELNNRMSNLMEQIKKLESENLVLINNVERHRLINNMQDCKIKEESEKCKNLEEDIGQLMMKGQEKDRELNNRMSNLMEKIKELENENLVLINNVETHRYRNNVLECKIKEESEKCKKLEGQRKELMIILELERAENKSFTREIGRLSNLVETSLKEGSTLKQLCLDHEQEDVLKLEERCRMLEVEKSAQLTMVEERCKRLEEELVKKMQDLDDHTQDERKFTSEKLLTSLNSAHTNIMETCQGVLDKQDTLLKVFMEASKHRNEAGSSTAEWEMLDYSVQQDIEEC